MSKPIRKRLQLSFEGQISRTKQAFKDECDVNRILAKYQKTQLITHVNSVQGSYGDFSNVTDYQTSLNAVMAADDRFMGLPAKIRAKFANNPTNLIAFLSDDKNYEEAIQLGLLDSQKAQAYLDKKAKAQSPKKNDDLNDNKK